MKRRALGEIAAGLLVCCSIFIPNRVFGQYISYVDVAGFAAAAELSLMVLNSLFAVAVVYYLAWRILDFSNRKE